MLVGITTRTLMLFFGGLLVVSYCSVLLNPSAAWFSSIAGLFFFPLFILNLLLLLWALFRRSGSALIPLVCLLPSLLFLPRYYQFSQGDPVEDTSTPTIKVVSYNVGRFQMQDGSLGIRSTSQCADSVFRMLKELDPDIICLQEYYNKDAEVRTSLSRYFKDYNIQYFIFPTENGSYGNVTLSRIPVVGKGKMNFEGSANLAIYSDYRKGETSFRVYNCHFESYNMSFPSIARSLWKDHSSTMKETEEKMKTSIVRRNRQVDQVLADIDDSPMEAIVVGDFNDTPISYTYSRLIRGRKDSFVQAGKGTGATYALLSPFIRIDYILYPSHDRAISHEVIHRKYSDHFPVLSEIALTPDPGKRNGR